MGGVPDPNLGMWEGKSGYEANLDLDLLELRPPIKTDDTHTHRLAAFVPYSNETWLSSNPVIIGSGCTVYSILRTLYYSMHIQTHSHKNY